MSFLILNLITLTLKLIYIYMYIYNLPIHMAKLTRLYFF